MNNLDAGKISHLLEVGILQDWKDCVELDSNGELLEKLTPLSNERLTVKNAICSMCHRVMNTVLDLSEVLGK